MTKLLRIGMYMFPLVLLASLNGCAWMNGMQVRSAVCSYDRAWDAALATVSDRSTDRIDKESGLIVTHWLEIPMPGRTYGVFQRDISGSKDRSRLTLQVSRQNDVSKISFIEERQSWGFRGGSRLFGWIPTDPSEEVMQDIRKRIDTKLQEQGCAVT